MKYKQLYLNSITEPKPGDEDNFIIRGVFSTGDEDRQGDVVVQIGWNVKEFLLNPVVLFAHDHWQPAVGQIIELGLNEQGNLAGAIQFAAKEYDFAMTLYKLYKGKYMRAFSAGFDSKNVTYDDEEDRNVLTENVLYEMSCVNVPANAYALAKEAGINTESLVAFQTKQLALRKAYHAKSPSCKLDDENESECISRKIKELELQGYEKEQASSIAYSVCSNECSQKKKQTADEIKSRLENIEKEISRIKAIGEVKTPTAVKKIGRQPSKKVNKILIKNFNRAIRSLLIEKRKYK